MNLGAMNTLKVLVFPPRASFDMPYSNQFYVKYISYSYQTFFRYKYQVYKAPTPYTAEVIKVDRLTGKSSMTIVKPEMVKKN